MSTDIYHLKAVAIAVAASFLVAAIEIPTTAEASLKSCLVAPSLIYWIVLSFGNVVTTLLASMAVDKLPASLSKYFFVFSAFFGVFASKAS